jgi:superfamily II RNA helicase
MYAVTKLVDQPCADPIPDDQRAFIFDPRSDNFQNNSFSAIHKGEIAFTSAPTGSGKTRIEYYAIAHHVRNGTVAVATPIKALSNQKYDDCGPFLDELKKQTGIEASLGIMTGDHKMNPDADIIIMTTEILKNSLGQIDMFKQTKEKHLAPTFIDRLQCVIFDEAHYINDEDRGGVWETIMTLLDLKVNIVLLSATLGGMEPFARWLAERRQRNVRLIISTKRVVPLIHYCFVDDEMIKIMTDKNVILHDGISTAAKKYNELYKDINGTKIHELNKSVAHLKKNNLLPAIYFVFSKLNCEKFARSISLSLTTPEEQATIRHIFESRLKQYTAECKNLAQYYELQKLIEKGIAYHHSGVAPLLKEIVEIIFKQGLIKLLFATETFAVGINMPTRTVIFTSIEKPTSAGVRRILHRAEYTQMAGRAGRRGKDKVGIVGILGVFDMPTSADIVPMMNGMLPAIQSKLKFDYSLVLNSLVVSNYDIQTFLTGSLAAYQNKMEIDRTKNELATMVSDIPEIDSGKIQKFDEYIKHLDDIKKFAGQGITIKLSQKQRKKMNALKSQVLTDADFIKYQEHATKQSEIDRLTTWIATAEVGYEKFVDEIIGLLKVYGFIDEIGPTKKGIIASQINDCNPLLMTEIVMGGILDDLTEAEIVSILSLFINENNRSDRVLRSDLDGKVPNVICHRIDRILDMIHEFISIEETVFQNDEKFWKLNYDYVIGAHAWANGCTFETAIAIIDIFPGNFIRNMLQLHKMVDDVISLLKIHGDHRLIPILQKIDTLIYRDGVSTSSLYLSGD